MVLQVEVGRRIRHVREQAGLSQADLAEAIGRTVQMVGRIERGRSAPSFETLAAIAEALQTPVALFFEVEPPAPVEAAGQLARRLKGLNEEEAAWVDQILTAALRRPRRP